MKNLTLLILLSFFSIISGYSQNPTCMPEYLGLSYSEQIITNNPPLSMYMPFDILIAYIALDSVSRHVEYNDFEKFLNNQTSINDTLRYIMKYLYKVVDYNPLLFYQSTNKQDNQISHPLSIVLDIYDKIEKITDKPLLDRYLLESSYIFHIRATDTIQIIDTSAVWARTVHFVSANVIDTIKGKVFPNCYIQENVIEGSDKKKLMLSDNPACIKFEYALEWERKGHGDITGLSEPLYDNDGNPWIKPEQEYIIFLRIVLICNDSLNTFFTISPFGPKSSTYNIYPINDGIVYDPGNDFGFGINKTADEFKSLLRERINYIINYP